MLKLRNELLHFPTEDGGLEVVDLLLQRLHRFSAAEARELQSEPFQPGRALAARLQELLLVEGPIADALRQSARHGQIRRAPKPPPDWPSAQGPWELAMQLPEGLVSAQWRDPERWRRLAEDRVAGRLLLRAEGFLTDEAARDLRARASAMPFEDQDGMYARGEVYNEEDGSDRLGMLQLFGQGPLNRLVSHVMGEDLPRRIFLRCWRLGPGHRIAVHNDGVHYVTTFSIGLSEGWTAARGGAITFGVPSAGGIEATERWLPHLGDLILFRPTAVSWHAVEEVREGQRMTITGHYVADEYPG